MNSLKTDGTLQGKTPSRWCEWRDLNPHVVRRQILSLVRLPFRHTRMTVFYCSTVILQTSIRSIDNESDRAVVAAFDSCINFGFFQTAVKSL